MQARATWVAASLAAAAGAALGLGCGGGGGGGPEAPFGLTTRVPVTTLTFPLSAPRPGAARVVDAFPSLPSFQSPVFVTHAPSGEDRLFVLERRGRVRGLRNVPSASAWSTFLDLASVVTDAGGEEGLLGLAFHPSYGTNGSFYVSYVEEGTGRTIVSRFQTSSNPDVADPGSETRLLVLSPPYTTHNGGMLAFGPDGYLYVSVGDGGDAGDPGNRAQNPSSLFGKILRIDVDRVDPGLAYAIPAGNPFAASTGGERREIYALGFRNPWRFSFDRVGGTLWCGDVGQESREEISIVRLGDNHGWRAMEGNRVNDGGLLDEGPFVPPLLDYAHADTGTCVIGGYVYRGSAVPALYGAYLYGDYEATTVWALTSDGEIPTSNVALDRVDQLSSFGEDRSGEVLLCSLGSGRLYRLEPNPTVPEPPFPQRLSETGLFSDVATLAPAPGLVPYDVNAPLWSDGAAKERWIALPGSERITWSQDGAWRFPGGTALVKTFSLPLVEGDPGSAVRVETRVLLLAASGWEGFVYRWRDDQTDADLIPGADARTFVVSTSSGDVERTWRFPSRTDCLRCHTSAAGRVLGLTTRQMNRDFSYPGPAGPVVDNQLRAWEHVGLFDGGVPDPGSLPAHPVPEDEALPVAPRARAYLEVNCSVCHRPGGTAATMDLRAHVPVPAMGVVGVRPTAGDLGLLDPYLVLSGDRTRSVLWHRVRDLGPSRMPPLATSLVDAAGEDLVGRWIDAGP
jgi:uncharacterized repeat protein (TIGR03806 family)